MCGRLHDLHDEARDLDHEARSLVHGLAGDDPLGGGHLVGGLETSEGAEGGDFEEGRTGDLEVGDEARGPCVWGEPLDRGRTVGGVRGRHDGAQGGVRGVEGRQVAGVSAQGEAAGEPFAGLGVADGDLRAADVVRQEFAAFCLDPYGDRGGACRCHRASLEIRGV